jgi:hypothetical protein
MAKGQFKTKGWAHVEYAPGWSTFPIAEKVYRERAYEPAFDDLPWEDASERILASYRLWDRGHRDEAHRSLLGRC